MKSLFEKLKSPFKGIFLPLKRIYPVKYLRPWLDVLQIESTCGI